jgi:hypothetical protein
MRFARQTCLLFGSATVLMCSLSNTPVLRAEDTPVYETPQPKLAPVAPQQTDPERSPIARTTASSPPRGDYMYLLVAGYIVAPILGAGLTLGLAQFNAGRVTFAAGLVGVFGAWLVPAMVHWSNDQPGLGFRALLSPPSLAIAATIVVSLLSYGVLTLANVPRPDPEDGTINRAVTSVEIGFVAAGVAVIAWAVFDVLDSAPSPRPTRTSSLSAVRFAVVPTDHGAAGLLSCRF